MMYGFVVVLRFWDPDLRNEGPGNKSHGYLEMVEILAVLNTEPLFCSGVHCFTQQDICETNAAKSPSCVMCFPMWITSKLRTQVGLWHIGSSYLMFLNLLEGSTARFGLFLNIEILTYFFLFNLGSRETTTLWSQPKWSIKFSFLLDRNINGFISTPSSQFFKVCFSSLIEWTNPTNQKIQ